MGDVDGFLEWLSEQDYWVKSKKMEQKAEEYDVEFGKMIISSTLDDDGDIIVPKRDYRNHIKYD